MNPKNKSPHSKCLQAESEGLNKNENIKRSLTMNKPTQLLNQTHTVNIDEKTFRKLVGNLESVEKLYGQPTWVRQFFLNLMAETGVDPDSDPITLFIDNPFGLMNFTENTLQVIDKILGHLATDFVIKDKSHGTHLRQIRDGLTKNLTIMEKIPNSTLCAFEVEAVENIYDQLMFLSYAIPCIHGQIVTHHFNEN